MTRNHLFFSALMLALAACGQSAPDPSGTYVGETPDVFFGGTHSMTIKIAPLPNSDGKYSIEQTIGKGHTNTNVLFYDQAQNKFCAEGTMVCITYSKTEGIRFDGDTEFLKRQE